MKAFKLLTSKERKEYVANSLEWTKNEAILAKRISISDMDFISTAFSWTRAPQEQYYWMQISVRIIQKLNNN